MTQELVWSTEIEIDAQNRWQRVRCILSQQGLGEALLGAFQPSIVRSASADISESTLLLSDVITLDDGLMALNILATRESPDTLAVEARLTTERPFAHPMHATLEWGGQVLTSPVNGTDRALFREVPINTLVDLESNRPLTGLKITVERSGSG